MAIEFSCPDCGQLVRTPDTAAGKKGRCPQCATVVQIPPGNKGEGVRHQQSGDRGPRAASVVPAADAIEFYCVACGQLVRTPATAAGKKGKCPHCETIVTIPALRKGAVHARPAPASSNPKITTMPQAAARPQPPSTARPQSKASTPSPSSASPKAQPQPRQPTPGLTSLPADPLGGLTPIGNDPLAGLAPLPGDPLAGLPVVSPLGYAAQPIVGGSPFGGPALPSPQLAPSAPYPVQPASSRPYISDYGRRGLSWENEPSFDSFWDTLWEVICDPQAAFQTMRRSGGIANPLGFLIVSMVMSQIIILLEVLALIAGLNIFLAEGEGLEALLISFGTSAVVQIISGLFSAAIGSFIGAAILHVALMLVGGANAGYEATYRVNAFGIGAIYMLMTIPCLGPLFALVLYFVAMINGLMYAHETSGAKAVFAVIIPPTVLACCICPLLMAMPNALAIPLPR